MISIVIPVYNERPTIPIILKKIKELSLEKEVIVIDDGSYDGTKEFLKSLKDPQIKVIFHPKNLGKGAAIKTGFKYAKGEVIVIQDADLEYHPEEIPQLIKPILDGYADVVYGSRFIGAHRAYLFTHYLGNKLLNLIANILYNTFLTDLMTGYKAFRREVVKNLKLEANGFGIEAEITAEVFKYNLKVYELPISYWGRTYEEGKKIHWYHFFTELYWLIRKKFTISNVPLETLLWMGKLKNYNRWIFNLIRPYLGNKILELGAGIGNITKYLLRTEQLVAIDICEDNLSYLKSNYQVYPNVKIFRKDITDYSSLEELKNYEFETIICLNVLEHIKEHKKALINIHNLMNKDTKLIITVPALSSLMGNLDVALGHYRRYDKKDLINLLEESGFYIEKIDYFNFIGSLGFFVNSKIFRKKNYSFAQLWIFDKMIKILKIEKLERMFRIPFGATLIAVCRKQ